MATLLKTVTYRVVSTTNSVLLGYWMTGSLKVAASLGAVNMVANSGIYYAFESLWSVYGPKTATA